MAPSSVFLGQLPDNYTDFCSSLQFFLFGQSISSKLQFGTQQQQLPSARLGRDASSTRRRPTCMHVWQTLPGYGNVWQALPTSVWQCMASCQHACMATHSYASSPICCRLFSQKESARGRLINLFLICKDLGARLARIYVLHIGLYALTPIQSNDISCLTNSNFSAMSTHISEDHSCHDAAEPSRPGINGW